MEMEYERPAPLMVYRLKTPMKIFLSFLYLLLLLVVFCLGDVLFEVLQDPSLIGFLAWFSGACMMLLFMYGTMPIWNTLLEFSPEGVTYTNPAYCRIYTPWKNIAAIQRITPFRMSTSFILREPATLTTSFRECKQRGQAVIERRSLLVFRQDLLSASSTVPFLFLVPKKAWEDGTIKAYIHYYAPHLLEHNRDY